ncbi:ATP-binding protein [Streptomyces sp. NPDC057909]|uniref:ATP-binding protein n=1 Tax=Streptomyces sp. NPDC057909 TaxID=3346277 RepID=UPI0036EAE506
MAPSPSALPDQAAFREHGGRRYGCRLPHGGQTPAVARHTARAVLIRWGVSPGLLDDALLVVSELVTNSVIHALPPVTLHLGMTCGPAGVPSWVHVGVTDDGPAFAPDPVTAWRGAGERGRDTALVSALATDTGTTRHPGGPVSHWATLTAA